MVENITEEEDLLLGPSLITTSLDELEDEMVLEEENGAVCLIDIEKIDPGEIMSFAKKKEDKSEQVFLVFYSIEREYPVVFFNIAHGFISKPITKGALKQVLKKIYSRIFQKSHLFKIRFDYGATSYWVYPDQIMYMEKHQNILTIKLQSGKEINIYDSIKNYEEQLKKDGFFRTHKSYLVNVNKISKVDFNKGEIMLDNGSICLLSRKKKSSLQNYMVNI